MPHTVPNRPTNGAVLPTEASTVRPDSRRAVSSSITRRIARVRNSAALPASFSRFGAVALVVARRDDRVPGEMRERLVGVVLLEVPLDGARATARSRRSRGTRAACAASQRAPASALVTMRYQVATDISEQDDEHRLADGVGLREKVGEAQAVDRFHAFLRSMERFSARSEP